MMTEKRLIDANALKRHMVKAMELSGVRTVSRGDLEYCIDNADTVDAVEVVRCKNCGESDPCDVSKGRVWCKRLCRYMDESGYCSEGSVDEALQQLP